MRARGPDFLAGDHPVVPVAPRTGAYACQIRSGSGFGKQLAPDILTGQGAREDRGFLGLGAVDHDRWPDQTDADQEGVGRYGIASFFLIPDHLFDRRRVASAEGARPGQSGPARFGFAGLPVARPGDLFGVAGHEVILSFLAAVPQGCVGIQPAPRV